MHTAWLPLCRDEHRRSADLIWRERRGIRLGTSVDDRLGLDEGKLEPGGTQGHKQGMTGEDIFTRLASLGIATATVPYPAHRTVEEGKALRGAMAGQFTKNLLLKDKKGALFMIVADEDLAIDLRRLHVHIQAQGRLGFAPPETMRDILRVEPGALTPFSLLHDGELKVRPVIDASLLRAVQLNFHPLVNTESTGIAPQDLLAFIASCGHTPAITDFAMIAAADA